MRTICIVLLVLLTGMPASVGLGQSLDAKSGAAPAPPQSLFGKTNVGAALRLAEKRARLAREAYDKAYVATLDLRQSIREKTGRIDVERDYLERAANKLDEDLQSLALEQAGSKARIEAIEEAIAEQSKRVEKASMSDPVIAELQKVADARERQLKLVENERKTGTVTDTTLQEAIASLAEARAKVAERRQAVFTGNGGDALTSLNRELLSLSIADRERRAKIQFLEGQLAKISPELGATMDLQFRERSLADAINDLRQAEFSLHEVQLSIDEVPEKHTPPETRPAKSGK